MSDDSEKYPPNIQKLFAPKPPLLYVSPIDYPSEKRITSHITPISSWKNTYDSYIKELIKKDEQAPKTIESKHQLQLKNAAIKKRKYEESFNTQLSEWNDHELLRKNEQEFMKDPFKTVFISRLDYTLSELDISKSFSKYGVIDSIRIIRDKSGCSRGYGFIAFERDSDAKNCVADLASTGLKILGEANTPLRTILVDIERGRLVRNWKPTRLGGGLGGRHYTKPDPRHSKNASAAASGRRLFLSNNPYNSASTSVDSTSRTSYKNPPSKLPDIKKAEKSVRDKYANYSSNSYDGSRSYKSTTESDRSRSSRSIRSIRQRD